MEANEKAEKNRRNAQMSTGPKTPEGKARSSRNALKHGLTADHLVVAFEDGEAFETLRDDLFESIGPVDALETIIANTILGSAWRMQRCYTTETTKLTHQVVHAQENFDHNQSVRADELGRRLVRDPVPRMQALGNDPLTLKKVNERLDNSPVILAKTMKSFAEGIEWLIHRISRIQDILNEECFLHYPEQHELVRLMGKRPEDMMNDPEVRKIFLACNVLHPCRTNYDDDCIRAKLGNDDIIIYGVRTDFQYRRRPGSVVEAFDVLREAIAAEIERLSELKEKKYDKIRTWDRKHATRQAMSDTTREGGLVLRYEKEQKSALFKSLDQLYKKRREDRAAAKAEKSAESETIDLEEEGSERKVHTRRTAPRNEPTETVPMSSLCDSEEPESVVVDEALISPMLR